MNNAYKEEKYGFYDFDELDFDEYLEYINGVEYQKDFLEYCLDLEVAGEQ